MRMVDKILDKYMNLEESNIKKFSEDIINRLK